MVANVAQEPSEIMSDVTARSQRLPGLDPPLLLRGSITPPDPLPPVRQDPAVVEMHARWADPVAPADGATGVAGRVRSSLTTAVEHVARSAQAEQRALIGTLIRAIDTVAARNDQLEARVHHLETLLEEVVTVLSEDLTQVRSALGAVSGPP